MENPAVTATTRTEAQREASRANGAQSPGALRHGLRAKTLVLSNEAPEVLEALIDEYTAEYQPETTTEFDLIAEMAYAKWRQHRVWLAESASINKQMAETTKAMTDSFDHFDESIRIAVAVESSLGSSRALDLYNRVETRCNRQYHRALSTLLALRKLRKMNERT
jgi:hypothetical protein